MFRILCMLLFSFVELSGMFLFFGDDVVFCVVFVFNVEEDLFVYLFSLFVWVMWIF